MSEHIFSKNIKKRLIIVYYVLAVFVFMTGMAIYTFFRNIDNMIMFRFFSKPSLLSMLNNPIKTDTIWSYMFVYNLPYGLWCFSGLLIIRALWLTNTKWRIIYGTIFIAIVMFYVILKLPKLIPGTFDVLDLLCMGFFAFVESLIFNMFIRRKIL
jgi:hypothetical protein